MCGPIVGLSLDITVLEDHRQLYAQRRDTTTPEGTGLAGDDDTQEQIQPLHLEPIDAYNHALVHFSDKLTELVTAIEGNDPELTGVCANDAVGAWVAADAACKRLADEIGEPHALLDSAMFGLTEGHHALQSLLSEAQADFANPTLQGQLKYLRASLDLVRK